MLTSMKKSRNFCKQESGNPGCCKRPLLTSLFRNDICVFVLVMHWVP